MRVVVLGAAGARRTEMAIVRAARALGHPCRLVDVAGWHRRLGGLADGLVKRLAEGFRPEAVIFTRHAHRLEPEVIRDLSGGRAGGVWYFDYAPTLAPELLDLARAVGRLYVTCRAQVDAYRAAGIPQVLFLPQAMDPAYDRPAPRAPSRYRCDLSFVGSGQYPDRHELLRRLAGLGSLQVRGPAMGERGRTPGGRRTGLGPALRPGRGRSRHFDRRARHRRTGGTGGLRLQSDLEGAGMRRVLSRSLAAGKQRVRPGGRALRLVPRRGRGRGAGPTLPGRLRTTGPASPPRAGSMPFGTTPTPIAFRCCSRAAVTRSCSCGTRTPGPR